jgi:hypothetical protein
VRKVLGRGTRGDNVERHLYDSLIALHEEGRGHTQILSQTSSITG